MMQIKHYPNKKWCKYDPNEKLCIQINELSENDAYMIQIKYDSNGNWSKSNIMHIWSKSMSSPKIMHLWSKSNIIQINKLSK